MTIKYVSLKKKPRRSAVEQRVEEIEQTIYSMPEVDQQFMYEKLKQNQHQERVFSAFLQLIRKYDFLPKRLHLEGFQEAVKHIYAANEKEVQEEEYSKKLLEQTNEICKELEEEN